MFMQPTTTVHQINGNNNSSNNNNDDDFAGGSRAIYDSNGCPCLLDEDETSATSPYDDLDEVSRLCVPICSRDDQVRQVALEAVARTLEGWLDGVGSPGRRQPAFRGSPRRGPVRNGCGCWRRDGATSNGSGGGGGRSCGEGQQQKRATYDDDGPPLHGGGYSRLVALHLPVILRLSLSCPFVDVRDKCRHILESVERRGIPIPSSLVHGPSAYIDHDELPPLGTFNEKTHTLFVDAFLQNNRLDHVTQVMGFHPTYLDDFLKTQQFIMRGDGPLPFDYRHYIAIMASGRHQCNYLINLQKQEFLLQGGDHNWLKGLEYIPRKLRSLYDINKILAHQPWLLNRSHIEKLTKGKDSWSIAEVVHAIVILSHFHSLCSFVFSCGVNQEIDQLGGYAYPAVVNGDDNASASCLAEPTAKVSKTEPKNIPSLDLHRWKKVASNGPPSPTEPEVGITTLMQRMKTLSERNEECSPVELTKRFENVESQSAELGAVGSEPQEAPADICVFVDDAGFTYRDFAKRHDHDDIMTFRVQDYSWDDHGYSMVNRLYNDIGNLLDEKFKTAYNLTYYTLGGRTDVDTSRFRRAIWNYIQCLLGIRHDDYNYGEINQLLERALKTFIKSACCFPERVTKKDYDRVMKEFRHTEKVHVNLMVLEARMQAELLYALRAVNRYLTN